jgi:cytochrome c-type biogenesis protein CcmH
MDDLAPRSPLGGARPPGAGKDLCVARGARKLGTARRFLGRSAFVCALALAPVFACAKEALPAAADPALEARMLAITAELRCLVCQNQTIADSHADLAQDLRRQVREMLERGNSNQQIIDFMTARYGDFVLYRPPLKATTAFLWFGPALLMVGGMSADRFDPDEPDADPDARPT